MKAARLSLLLSAFVLACGPAAPPASPPVVAIASPPVAPEPTAPEPPPAVAATGWTMFHGNPARTGHSDAPAIQRPRVRWQARVGLQGWLNGPVIAGQTVLVPSSGIKHNARDPKDGVYSIALDSGAILWHAPFDGDANGVAVAGDQAIATADDGSVIALDLRTAKVVWRQKGEGKMYAHPLPLGDRVIVGDAGGWLRAYSLRDGAPLWKVRLAGAIRGGAASDGINVYVGTQEGEIAAIDNDGKVIWRLLAAGLDNRPSASPVSVYSTPIVSNSMVIVPYARDTYYDTPALLALDKKTGRLLWDARGNGSGDWGNLRSTPALVDGTLVYAEAYSGDVVGIDAQAGGARYRTTVGPCFFPQWASPAAAGDVVYVPRYDGALYAVHAKSGAALWQLYLGNSQKIGPTLPPALTAMKGCEWDVPPGGTPLFAPPAIADDGTVLIGSGEGVLYAIEETR